MILFDKSKLMKFSSGKVNKLMDILYYVTYRPLPESSRDASRLKYQSIHWKGDSYLLNPEDFIDQHHRYTKKEVLQYFLVASKRSLPDYLLFGTKTLSMHSVNINAIKNNRLLTVTDEKIFLKFEEA